MKKKKNINSLMRLLLCGYLLVPFLVSAQIVELQKPVFCEKSSTVLGALIQDGGELPAWIGSNETNRTVLLVNKTTKTWSIVQFDVKLACVIGSGENSKEILTGPVL